MIFLDTSNIGDTVAAGKYENGDNILILKSLIPDKLRVKIKIDDIRLRSILTTNKIKGFTEKFFSVQY